MAEVKIRPAAIEGLPMPSPSLATHLTCSVSENSAGSAAVVLDTPEQFGPRN